MQIADFLEVMDETAEYVLLCRVSLKAKTLPKSPSIILDMSLFAVGFSLSSS
jgi:hypothetical protein